MRYKFRYFNGTLKILSIIFIPLQNLLIPRASVLIIARLVSLVGLGQYLNNDIIINALQKIVLICSISWAVMYCVLKKGVFLKEDRLVINRYTITLRNWKNRISINYNEIESVIINYNDLRFTRHHGSLLVPFGDETYNIELTLKNGTKYFFSIENQEDFIEELNERIERTKK